MFWFLLLLRFNKNMETAFCSAKQFLTLISVLEFTCCFIVSKAPLLQSNKTIFTPVILVPGGIGSQLEGKLDKPDAVSFICKKKTEDYVTLWLNVAQLVPMSVDCLVDNLRLVYDSRTNEISNAPGVIIRVPGFGNTSSIEWLDPSEKVFGAYFRDIVKMLVDTCGLKRGISVRGAPYDWRKVPNENERYFERLKILVEDTYKKNDNRSVAIISHSLGGLMTLHFLHQQTQDWKNKHIKTFIAMGTPWGGSVQALRAYTTGTDLGISLLSKKTLRRLEMTLTSTAWLLPSKYFWHKDEVLMKAGNLTFTSANYTEFFNFINFPTGIEMRKRVQRFITEVQEPPGVSVHCLHGDGLHTVERLEYPTNEFKQANEPELILGDGDETVNRRSLEGCVFWYGKQSNSIQHHVFNKINHIKLLSDDDVLQYVAGVITAS